MDQQADLVTRLTGVAGGILQPSGNLARQLAAAAADVRAAAPPQAALAPTSPSPAAVATPGAQARFNSTA